ncbi:hypothetical protein LRP52_27270 [Photobacterium sp. ZSDE20]|uniref:Serine hydrolase n=1 Tax=Photobacterium pectinilyticum TaxID=2906793 RepID=A0ABT1N4P2_9GAMM|nr:hypothetical protein [Photobacterium sp. ZSDE20]MCQ1059715.1 hypothetical protein [Photobacterium sp. ZSDE20]MDD1825881.1 hypothetical protein [Photobacterium sp. ZSDE20]
MKFKRTLLATTVFSALALTGCGSDSGSNEPGPTPSPELTQGQFIDAAVEGLYFESQPSDKSGFTDADGIFEFDADDTVTFYLGGENGLRIGQVSSRAIVSPFEATGNYQKALNLARILQTADETDSNTVITLPESLKSPSADMIAALQNVMLHDLDTADALKTALNISDWISEEDALEHLDNALSGLERGSNEILTEWQKGSGNYLREVSSSLNAKDNADAGKHMFIHADKLLDSEVFEAMETMKTSTYHLSEDQFTVVKGSNDTVQSGTDASYYLACIDEHGIDAAFIGYPQNTCNGDAIDIAKFALNNLYQHSIVDPRKGRC